MLTSNNPYSESFAITPSDTVDLVGIDKGQGVVSEPARALYIGVAGDVTLIDVSGQTTLFKAVPVGELRVSCKRVKATGTTATNIVGLR